MLVLVLHRHVGQAFETSEGLVITRAMSCGDYTEQAGRDDSVLDQLATSIGLREQIGTKQRADLIAGQQLIFAIGFMRGNSIAIPIGIICTSQLSADVWPGPSPYPSRPLHQGSAS